MSSMYGPRRVVLKSSSLVCICGSDGQGGLYAPIGWWYKAGLYYADLLSPEHWYSNRATRANANKGLGGKYTKQELREFIMAYWLRCQKEAK
jgi:hypothetical protein